MCTYSWYYNDNLSLNTFPSTFCASQRRWKEKEKKVIATTRQKEPKGEYCVAFEIFY